MKTTTIEAHKKIINKVIIIIIKKIILDHFREMCE